MPEDYAVSVVRVIDGDSVKVRVGREEYSVRMYGIDAPEKDQRGGSESQRYLTRVLNSRRDWRLRVIDEDRYQRLVGLLYPEGGSPQDSANHRMVEAGWAYWYREYGGGELGFDASERIAQRERAGVWADPDAVRPWDHRRAKRGAGRQRQEAGQSIWLTLIVGMFKVTFQLMMALMSASGSGRSRRRRRRRRW